ncbi:protein of unknown function (plasmid) [Rhodovastum atsumiense]|nr:protein of unknown function [Rhodovastum atsumiense]
MQLDITKFLPECAESLSAGYGNQETNVNLNTSCAIQRLCSSMIRSSFCVGCVCKAWLSFN